MTYEAGFGEDAEDEGADQFEELERLCRESLTSLEYGDADRARDLACEAVALDEEHPFPQFVLALIAEQEGDLAAARYLSDQALRTAATNSDALQFRAQLHVREYEFEQAEQLLRFGVVHNPEDAELHESLARVFLARGKHREAAGAAQASLRLDPSNSGAHAVRVAALEEAGDADTLLAVLRQGVQLHPDDPYTIVELAAVEAEHGNVERARVLLARAQRLAPRDPQVADVRATIEGAHEHPLLRPLPRMLRWLRDFPGGLPGFLLGFVVAALPLYELTQRSPAYSLPVWLLLGAWGLFAGWCWVGAELLSVQLNLRAARASQVRLEEQRAEDLDVERVFDTVALFALARRTGQGVQVLQDAAARLVEPAAAAELRALAQRYQRRRERLLRVVGGIPADTRILIAIAFAVALAAPVLQARTGQPVAAYHAAAASLTVLALGLARIVPHQLALLAQARDQLRVLVTERGMPRSRGNDGPPLRAAS